MRATLLVVITAAFAVTSSLEAQASAAAAARTATEVQAWVGELEQLHGRLESIQQQALRDAEISAAQAELGQRIKWAMERLDPALERSLGRMRAMEAEAASARQKGDTGRLQQLGSEADQIQRQFAAAQERVLQQPEIASQVASFQERLERRMAQINPETARLVARFKDLESRLAQAGR